METQCSPPKFSKSTTQKIMQIPIIFRILTISLRYPVQEVCLIKTTDSYLRPSHLNEFFNNAAKHIQNLPFCQNLWINNMQIALLGNFSIAFCLPGPHTGASFCRTITVSFMRTPLINHHLICSAHTKNSKAF